MAEWNPGIHEEPASNPKMWACYLGVNNRRKVYIHDIPRHLTTAEVEATLGLPDDRIIRCVLSVDEEGRSKGFAIAQVRLVEDNWNVTARINGTDSPFHPGNAFTLFHVNQQMLLNQLMITLLE